MTPVHDWEDLYQRAPCGYVVSDPDGSIVSVNETFLDWTGHRRESLVGGARLLDLFAPGDRILYETHYAPLLRLQGFVHEIAVTLTCPDGRRLPALINATVDDAAMIRTAVFLATDRRSYERELLEARRRAERSEARATLLAQTLQTSLLPPELPQLPGVEMAAVYRPAGRGDEVGGDFYDVFEVRRDDWTVIMGDVCGKGAAAAVLTSLVRHTARAIALRARRPSTLLGSLNRTLYEETVRTGTMCFSTAVCLRLQLRPGGEVRLTVALAGHPPPLLLTGEGEPEPVARIGTLLGALPSTSHHDVSLALRPGDALVLYTDGVTEARNGHELFGEERLTALLATFAGRSAADIAGGITDAVLSFQDNDASDDIAVVVIKAASSPR